VERRDPALGVLDPRGAGRGCATATWSTAGRGATCGRSACPGCGSAWWPCAASCPGSRS